jgi:hypothetical protein
VAKERVLVEVDGEALAMMHFAVPLEFRVHVAELFADIIDFIVNAVAVIVAVVQFVVHALEISADVVEFVADMVAAADVGFIAQMAIPLPEAMHIGAQVLVMPVVVVGLESRHCREQGCKNAKGEKGSFHKGSCDYRGK